MLEKCIRYLQYLRKVYCDVIYHHDMVHDPRLEPILFRVTPDGRIVNPVRAEILTVMPGMLSESLKTFNKASFTFISFSLPFC